MPNVVKTTEIACSASEELDVPATISCAVGAPYQGVMRQLATDRWNYMYPSTSS
jgi:hypothetical protein